MSRGDVKSTPELLQKTFEERQCRIDGKLGIVERVYFARGLKSGVRVAKAKVIMDTGRVVYVPLNECAMF